MKKMKKTILLAAAILCPAFASAQGVGLNNDTLSHGFLKTHLWDTVSTTDSFYMFKEVPDSGLYFRMITPMRESNIYCDSTKPINMIISDTFLLGWFPTIRCPQIGTRYHTDKPTQLYGIAVTMSPWEFYGYGLREGDLACYSTKELDVDEFNRKRTENYRVELLEKKYSGTDSLMEVKDYLWLDKKHLIKRCWFKYHIDNPGADSLLCHHQSVYYPGLSDMVVPCVEFYFDDPFDTTHVVDGDFYVGRSHSALCPYTTVTTSALYEMYGQDRFFHPRELVPYYKTDSNYHDEFIYYDAATGIIQGKVFDFIGGTKYEHKDKRPWGLIFPITGLRCGQLHNVHLEEKGEAYALLAWQGGEDDDTAAYQVRLIDRNKGGDGIIDSGMVGDTSYMFTSLYEDGHYTFQIRKRCHYATSRYDTVVWSDWYSYPFNMREDPVDTTDTDTTGIDTTQIDTTGIRLALGDADFSLRPNPARGSAELRLQYPVAETAELTLYDMRGREVRRVALRRGDKTVRLDLDGLPAGAYLLKLLTPHGLATRRLLVQ